MIPRLGDGNATFKLPILSIIDGLENDFPSRGRKLEYMVEATEKKSLENDSPSRGRKLYRLQNWHISDPSFRK